MAVECTNCGAAVKAEEVDLHTRLAKCVLCDEVFSIGDQVAARAPGRQRREALAAPPPPSMRVERSASHLILSRSWFTPMAFGLLLFCVMWDSFLVLWYATTLSSQIASFQWIAIVFPLGHVAVGVGLTWTVVAMFLNTTTIQADYEALSVRHGPVKWPGNKSMRAEEITQIICDEVKGDENRWYRLFVRTVDGRKVKLLSRISDEDEAQFIRQEIERFLGLSEGLSE